MADGDVINDARLLGGKAATRRDGPIGLDPVLENVSVHPLLLSRWHQEAQADARRRGIVIKLGGGHEPRWVGCEVLRHAMNL